MPIVVPCVMCPAQLSAPESAAGKQIRCPKCKAIATVPAFVPAEEVPVVEAKVTAPAPAPAPKPKPKPAGATTTACCVVCNTMVSVLGKVTVIHCPKCGFANPVPNRPGESEDEPEDDRPRKKKRPAAERDDDDDEEEAPRKKKKRPRDDDDDDDEPPRKKKRKAARGGGGGGTIAVVVIVGLLLLVGVGLGIYFLTGKGGVFASRAAAPTGWKQYDYPQSGFKAYFPSEPTVFGANMQPGGFGFGGQIGGVEIPQIESMHSYTTGGGFGGRAQGPTVTVEVNRYSTSIPRQSRDLMTRGDSGRFSGGTVKRVRWLGGDAAEIVTGGTLMRMVVLEKVIVIAQITGANGGRAKPEEEAGFFDNVELTR